MTNRDIILQSIGIIESRLKAEVTVSDVARKAGYSLFHFIRLFQGVTGCTPKDYILQRKLSEGDTSVISDLWARFFPEAARIANRDQPEKYYQLTFRPEEDCEDGFFCMAALEALHLDSIPIMSFLKSPSPR